MAKNHDHSHHDHSHDHGHDHHDDHEHSHSLFHHHDHPAPSQFNNAFAWATIINLLFVAIEAVYAIAANSMGLLADAAHNFGDVLGLLMAWGANILLSRGATEKYSYGYKKTTILSALANALILVFSSGIIIYESIHKLLHPVPVHEGIIMLVAFIGIFVNGGTALLFSKNSDKDLNVKSAFLHLAYDALISLGVVITGAIIYFTGWVRIDPLVGIAIVLIILFGTWDLLRNSVDLILGAVPRGIDQKAVREYLNGIAGVTAIHDLHIWGLSTQENALTAHLIMPEVVLTDADFQRINHDLLHDFKINHVTIQVERGSAEDACGRTEVCH